MTEPFSPKQDQQAKYPRKHLFAVAACSATIVLALTFLPSPDATATKTVRLKPPVIDVLSPVDTTNTTKSIASDAKTIQQQPADLLSTTNPEPNHTDMKAAALKTKAAAVIDPTIDWKIEKVRSGDTLSHIFKRVGLNSKTVHNVVHGNGDVKLLNRLHPGQTFKFDITNNELHSLEFVISRTESLLVSQANGDYKAEKKIKSLVPFTSYAEGRIDSSLFLAAQEAGLSQGLIMELAGIFGWDVDFVLDIRKGDSFRVIYQELHLDGEKVKDGNILAAEFINQGHKFTAVRYETSDRGASYFTPKGDSMRKAFLRSPIDFARISSHFNLRRKHPVLHTIRAHKGTDYAASRGTPIKSTGDGKVIFAARKGGYGRVVIVQHGQKYRTLYAHLNGFGRGIRAGTRVRQGQLVGTVGSSGLATGPHLHYEFYVNGSVRNPVTVKLPHANPISKADKTNFLATADKMKSQLNTYAAAMESERLAKAE